MPSSEPEELLDSWLGDGVEGFTISAVWRNLGDVAYTPDFSHNCREFRHKSMDLYQLYKFFMSLCYYI